MKKNSPSPEHDQSLFSEAMSDVKPLKSQNTAAPYRQIKKRTPDTFIDEENLDAYHLSDAVDHQAIHSNDLISYNVSGFSPQSLKKLRAGKVLIENRLDLHGSTIEQARQQVSHFIYNNQQLNKKCVLIVHGKGSINSPPKIKSMLNHWLRQIPDVLAFCSAQNQQGGSGAVYVLIKKNRHSSTSSALGIDK